MYTYKKGFNLKAVYALVVGLLAALIGLLIPDLSFLYDYAWLVGFAVAFFCYWILMRSKAKPVALNNRFAEEK